ncbi:hypothetical protein SLEP1_g52692 [Rubroshorea leprosula]|uniref:Transposase n=1 Tax=Rubroshorea leprosula TaxID=152421 RepID=A0AAV5M7V4_9ROSI|nr:hypothetical protein SLEP1_g52692 [Rubroshorea leprosula]
MFHRDHETDSAQIDRFEVSANRTKVEAKGVDFLIIEPSFQSTSEEKKVNEFQTIIEAIGVEEVECLRRFRGREFRSPTLFEDMVKCILLCNHQIHLVAYGFQNGQQGKQG